MALYICAFLVLLASPRLLRSMHRYLTFDAVEVTRKGSSFVAMV
jgi:hypothetical protein